MATSLLDAMAYGVAGVFVLAALAVFVRLLADLNDALRELYEEERP